MHLSWPKDIGLFIWDKSDKRFLKTRKEAVNHKTPGDLVYRIRLRIPGTDTTRTTTLQTRDLIEARAELLIHQKHLKDGIPVPKAPSNPMNFGQCWIIYQRYMNNVGVPEHRIKIRTTKHIKECNRHFKMFQSSLSKNGYTPKILKIYQITDEMIGKFHLEIKKKYAPKTYNKIISTLRRWYGWLIRQEYKITNPFEGITKRQENIDIKTITKDQFNSLLKSLAPAKKTYKYKGRIEHKQMYRDWLGFAFRLGLETGRRREEVINIRWCDVDLKNSIITVEDFKVSRQQGIFKDIHVPITESLLELLEELGSADLAKSDLYIIDPNSKMNRESMKHFISRAFSFYCERLGYELQFKCLRKTYITRMVHLMGGDTTSITGHADMKVITDHYHDKKQVNNVVKSFRIFE